MSKYDYDLFVVGAGSGGVRAGRLAGMLGLKVGVAEADRAGGTCVVRGCMPKKFMMYASDFARQFETARGFGWTVPEPAFDFGAFMTAKDVEIARLSGAYASNLMKAGADLVHAHARLLDAHTIELVGKGRTVTADKILIATGGRPWLPDDVPGVEHAITSDEAFQLKTLPRRVLIAGGGYIAVEFAGIFAGLGVETTLVYRGPNLLRGFDDDVRSHLAEEMRKRGVRVVLGAQHDAIEKTSTGFMNLLSNGMTLETDVVMFAVGRRPHTTGLGLEAAGVELAESGAIKVDAFSRTTAENIWAVGDVTDRVNLTPVAIREAVAFVETVFKNNPTRFDYDNIPTGVFSQPPVGVVGLTEGEARHRLGQVDVYLSKFRPSKVAFYGGDERALMKLVVDGRTDAVVGVHIVGPEAPEIIQLAALAVRMGATKAQWDATCALHPTLAEELVTMSQKVSSPISSAAE